MWGQSRRARRSIHASFLSLAGLCLFSVPFHTRAAENDLDQIKAQLQAQIDAMKAQYEGRIEALEKRIDTLESDNTRLKRQAQKTSNAAAPTESNAAEVAALKHRVNDLERNTERTASTGAAASVRASENAEAIANLEKKLAASATETRDIYRDDSGWPFDLTKLYDLPRPLEFHGYLRSGFGLNGEGGKMEAFKAPGAGAKYRLGNESDTYGEIGLVNNWLRQDDPLRSPYVRLTVMMSFSTAENFSYDSLNNQAQGNDIALRQAFVEGGNVFQNMPEMRFWAGQRYYKRYDIHINDFYFLDMSGYGAGVEDVPLAKGLHASLAWLGGSVDNYTTDDGNVAKQNFDFRITDENWLPGKTTLWLDYSNTQGGEVRNVFKPNGSPFKIGSAPGWAIGLIQRTPEEAFLGGYNEFSIQYGSGAAYNFASTLDTSGPDLDDAWRFRVTDHFTIQPVKQFAMQTVGLYEETEFGGPNSRNRWASFGIRPVYFFNDRFSTALETGVDWAESEPMGTSGSLWKITLAPQISRGGKFFSRPTLRAFITYAKWSDDFRGFVGGSAYQTSTEGFSAGVQAEAWW
jgi:maltoporin